MIKSATPKRRICAQLPVSKIGINSKLGCLSEVGYSESLYTGSSKGIIGIVTNNEKYSQLYPDAIGVDRDILLRIGDIMTGHIG